MDLTQLPAGVTAVADHGLPAFAVDTPAYGLKSPLGSLTTASSFWPPSARISPSASAWSSIKSSATTRR